MIRDITIGQYYQTDSVIHRLDPRVKLMGTLVYIISLFLGRNIWLYLLATIFLAVVIKLSKVPLKFILKGLKAVVVIIALSAAFNLFLTAGEPLIKIWEITITKEGLILAIFMVVRLIYLIAYIVFEICLTVTGCFNVRITDCNCVCFTPVIGFDANYVLAVRR